MEHVDIPDGERHEPKGIASATEDQVYFSDGAASGVWADIPYFATATLTDVSTASFVLIAIPVNVEIQSIRFVLANAVTVGDATITVTRNGADAMGSTVIPFTGSAEGTTVDLVPSGNNVIDPTLHNYIKIASDGGSDTAARLFIGVKGKVVN